MDRAPGEALQEGCENTKIQPTACKTHMGFTQPPVNRWPRPIQQTERRSSSCGQEKVLESKADSQRKKREILSKKCVASGKVALLRGPKEGGYEAGYPTRAYRLIPCL